MIIFGNFWPFWQFWTIYVYSGTIWTIWTILDLFGSIWTCSATPPSFWGLFVPVLPSAHVKRFSVSCMQYFSFKIKILVWTGIRIMSLMFFYYIWISVSCMQYFFVKIKILVWTGIRIMSLMFFYYLWIKIRMWIRNM